MTDIRSVIVLQPVWRFLIFFDRHQVSKIICRAHNLFSKILWQLGSQQHRTSYLNNDSIKLFWNFVFFKSICNRIFYANVFDFNQVFKFFIFSNLIRSKDCYLLFNLQANSYILELYFLINITFGLHAINSRLFNQIVNQQKKITIFSQIEDLIQVLYISINSF